MRHPPSPLSPEVWLHDVFARKAVQEAGVIRRKARDVERFVGWERFCHEVQRRGWRAYRNGDQVVVFCNSDVIQRIA